ALGESQGPLGQCCWLLLSPVDELTEVPKLLGSTTRILLAHQALHLDLEFLIHSLPKPGIFLQELVPGNVPAGHHNLGNKLVLLAARLVCVGIRERVPGPTKDEFLKLLPEGRRAIP